MTQTRDGEACPEAGAAGEGVRGQLLREDLELRGCGG